jgi:hypothetical protein
MNQKTALLALVLVAAAGSPALAVGVFAAPGYIDATGIGLAEPKIRNLTARRVDSRAAAIVQARYWLLVAAQSHRQPKDGTTSLAEDKLAVRINREIKGARVTKTHWASDDSCTVTLRMDREHFEQMTGTKLPAF